MITRAARTTLLLTVAVATIAALIPVTTFAANTNGAWITDGNANWSDANTGSWLGGAVADGASFTADFSTIDITAELRTVNMAQNRTIGHLIFGDTNPANGGSWMVSGSNTLTLDNTGGSGAPTIRVNELSSGDPRARIYAPLAGTGGFIKTGVGRL